jgi:polyisoprenyl-phosphate glycosyltransferase
MLSIIIPAYNEEEVLDEFYRCMTGVLFKTGLPYEKE